MNDLTIRTASDKDWPAIAAMLTQAALPLDGALAHLAHFLVGEREGEVVAAAGLEPYGDAALLRSVVVDVRLRGRAVGDAVVGEAVERARRQGFHRMVLLTTTAEDFFARRGFRKIARADVPQAMLASREFQGACPASAAVLAKDLLPVAVLGAGPVGLAAAAHLLARGMQPLILEAGDAIAANLESYAHVRLFSPWEYNVDRAARSLLEQAGWRAPADADLPTAGDLLRDYLRPLAALPAIAPHLRLRHRVRAIGRLGIDKVKTAGRAHAPFVVHADTPDGERTFLASAVIDATGTWSQPNPLGANGLPALGEHDARARIAYGMPDVLGAERARYANRHVLVVGAGHSAAGTLLALAQLAEEAPGTRIAWALRGERFDRIFGGGAADGLPARGELGTKLQALKESGRLDLHTGLRIQAIETDGGRLRVVGQDGRAIEAVDEIVAATGARPDLSLARELRVRHDPWLDSTDALAPLIDPNEHSCGTVRPHGHAELAHPEPGYYAIGAKSYGRAPNFLLATGYEQARSVVAALAGDMAAANDVQLSLPETGVCSTQFETDAAPGSCCAVKSASEAPKAQARKSCCGAAPVAAPATSCCGGPAPAGSGACCVLDADSKAQGKAGCGCA